jgi:hypothetical protein
MTELSPQTQKILHEFWNAPVSPSRNVQIAAALRAAWEQLKDPYPSDQLSTFEELQSQFLAIAAELEGKGNG